METKRVFLSDIERRAVDVIVERGFAETPSGAVRIALRQFAAAIQFHPPLITPSSPVL